jgi:DnaJ-domain-containing protein 1
MDPVNYYITTITTAFKNIAPVLIFLVGGYFIFIKMPFLFLKKSMSDQKKKFEDPKDDKSEKYTLEHYKEFQKTLKLMNHQSKSEKSNTDEPKKETKKDSKKINQEVEPTPEEMFNFKVGESITQKELKKRYFELLKQNHPDRVASMGQDFKKLAERNTKDINKAYEKLKKKAS